MTSPGTFINNERRDRISQASSSAEASLAERLVATHLMFELNLGGDDVTRSPGAATEENENERAAAEIFFKPNEEYSDLAAALQFAEYYGYTGQGEKPEGLVDLNPMLSDSDRANYQAGLLRLHQAELDSGNVFASSDLHDPQDHYNSEFPALGVAASGLGREDDTTPMPQSGLGDGMTTTPAHGLEDQLNTSQQPGLSDGLSLTEVPTPGDGDLPMPDAGNDTTLGNASTNFIIDDAGTSATNNSNVLNDANRDDSTAKEVTNTTPEPSPDTTSESSSITDAPVQERSEWNRECLAKFVYGKLLNRMVIVQLPPTRSRHVEQILKSLSDDEKRKMTRDMKGFFDDMVHDFRHTFTGPSNPHLKPIGTTFSELCAEPLDILAKDESDAFKAIQAYKDAGRRGLLRSNWSGSYIWQIVHDCAMADQAAGSSRQEESLADHYFDVWLTVSNPRHRHRAAKSRAKSKLRQLWKWRSNGFHELGIWRTASIDSALERWLGTASDKDNLRDFHKLYDRPIKMLSRRLKAEAQGHYDGAVEGNYYAAKVMKDPTSLLIDVYTCEWQAKSSTWASPFDMVRWLKYNNPEQLQNRPTTMGFNITTQALMQHGYRGHGDKNFSWATCLYPESADESGTFGWKVLTFLDATAGAFLGIISGLLFYDPHMKFNEHILPHEVPGPAYGLRLNIKSVFSGNNALTHDSARWNVVSRWGGAATSYITRLHNGNLGLGWPRYQSF